MWLLFAAAASVLALWLEPRLSARSASRKARVAYDETAPAGAWGGGPPVDAARREAARFTGSASTGNGVEAEELEGLPIRLPALAPWPAASDAAGIDAIGQGGAEVDREGGAALGLPATTEVAVESGLQKTNGQTAGEDAATELDEAAEDVATTASIDSNSQPDAGFGWDPNGPLVVPLYTSVPLAQAPANEQLPTMGGGSLGSAGGNTLGAGGAGGFTIGGAGAGGSLSPHVGAAGGTAVGSAGAFGIASPPATPSPFAIPVAWVLTPYGWILVPVYPVIF